MATGPAPHDRGKRFTASRNQRAARASFPHARSVSDDTQDLKSRDAKKISPTLWAKVEVAADPARFQSRFLRSRSRTVLRPSCRAESIASSQISRMRSESKDMIASEVFISERARM